MSTKTKASGNTERPKSRVPHLPGLLTGIDLSTHKTLRLAVSGDVPLNALETRAIDTAAFQRLRGIRQLGTACWVYPTALHTRFDHSLGTHAMAVRMIHAIRDNPRGPSDERYIATDEEQLIRLYALLHDITHIPFGHTIEDECCIFPRHDENPLRLAYFLGEESEIGRVLTAGLGGELYQRLMRLFHAAAGDTDALKALGDDRYILDLITGTLCADLLDYLRRDAFFCNVSLESDYRFLQHLAISRHEGRRRLVIRLWKEGKPAPRRDVLNELIRLLDNRYLMGERVYFHHAKLVSGAMLAGAVQRASRAGELDQQALWTMGDDVLLWKLTQSADPAARRLAERLGARALWKPVYERGRSFIEAEQQSARDRNIMQELMARYYADATGRAAAEDRIAGLLGMQAGDFLLHCPHHNMAMKSAGMLVFWNGALRPLKDCSDDELVGAKLRSILDSHQNLWAIRGFVNSEHLARRDALADACDSLFTSDAARRRRFEGFFYGPLLEQEAREAGLGAQLPHAAFQERLLAAREQLFSVPEQGRDRARLQREVRQAFAG